ncbi:MAG TPA: alpha-L-fucosidase, partial [Candidatus Paceibacterota bacterium]|nr:alpha-L-fucosidase [Candidatus Paceibacterota bacterium]
RTPSAATVPRPYPDRLRWWADARFGIFIHWGPVSLKGTEISWSRANTNPKCPNQGSIPAAVYDNLYKDFNPRNFDAAQWVSLMKAAGAKYIVLTAKHCDGFLLWHSKASDYNMASTPFQRDICAELSKATRAQGMKIGWYFSPMDWRDPDFRTERNGLFLARMQLELRELLSHYGLIDLLWFDWDGREPLYNQPETYALVKRLQPQAIINNRLDLGKDNNDRQILSSNADYYTPEQHVGAYDDQCPWESCMTTSRKNQWAWGGDQDGVKSADDCLRMLIRCAGGDGNMLLNVGPTPTGEIAPEQASLLRQMGRWLAQNDESIFATRGGPFKPGDYGVSTRKGNTIYLHILDWIDDAVRLPAIPAKVIRGRLLGGGTAEVRQIAAGLEVFVPESDRKPLDTIVALELDRSAIDLAAVEVPGVLSLATRAKAIASNTYQEQAQFGPDRAVDGNSDTRWATDADAKAAWLEVDLGKPIKFGRVYIKQAYPELNRVRKFAIESWQNGQWKTCYQGENLGASLSVRFASVTARRVRLNITEATEGPTIWEFQLFK